MKRIIIFASALILLASCYMSPTGIKYYQPVIDISMNDTLRFVIDPGEDDEWNWEDEDSLNISIVFSETEGLAAYITEFEWIIRDYDGNSRQRFEKIFTSPQKIEAKSEDTLSILFFLNGHYANDLDEEDGAEDGVACGIVEMYVRFYDDNGVTFVSRPFYRHVIAVKP